MTLITSPQSMNFWIMLSPTWSSLARCVYCFPKNGLNINPPCTAWQRVNQISKFLIRLRTWTEEISAFRTPPTRRETSLTVPHEQCCPYWILLTTVPPFRLISCLQHVLSWWQILMALSRRHYIGLRQYIERGYTASTSSLASYENGIVWALIRIVESSHSSNQWDRGKISTWKMFSRSLLS